MESGSRPGLQQETGRGGGGGWVLVEARLRGGAPWGFTLQGGLEHGEPLIISKVEEGGKADRLEQSLLIGDEIIIINDVKLSGFRQEAIALIKGSHKALQLTIRRELLPRCIEDFNTSPHSLPSSRRQTSPAPNDTTLCSAVQLRIKNRRSDPASRPHSWHSTKLGDGQHKLDLGGTNMSGNLHHPHLTSASTTDLCGGFDSGGDYLRKSPDQYSSRGSMESLDPPLSSQHHHGVQQHHPLGHHGHSGSYPAYSSCHQLSYARSSNSIDHLHSKRDSAYSSFSTSSSIPEYLASTPSFSSERSYSMETVPQRGGGTVFDNQRGFSHDHELSSNSTVPQHIRESRDGDGGWRMQSQDLQGSVGGVCYYANSCSSSNGSSSGGISSLNRHSMGSLMGPTTSGSSYEDLKGAPAPPRRSDSYSVTKNHDRPNSWSSVEHARSLRSLQRGPWHHSSGSVASGTAKGSYNVEGQLHTVIEKSPESSPTTKPKQSGGFPQPFSQTDTPSGVAGSTLGFNQLTFPTSVFPVPHLDPQYSQAPSPSLQSDNSGVYPSLAREPKQLEPQGMPAVAGRDEAPTEGGWDRKMSAEDGHPHSSYPTSASTHLKAQHHETQRHHKAANFTPSKAHNQSGVSNSKSQKGKRSPNNRQPNIRNLHGLQCKNQGHHNHVSQEQTEINPIYHTPSAPDLRALAPKERIDGSTSVEPWENRSRSVDQSSTYSEPVAYCGPAQGQMPPRHIAVHAAHHQPQTFSTPQSTSRHLSDSAAIQFQPLDHRVQESKDEDHLLTRLENALTDVQQIPNPDVDFGSSHERSSFVDSTRGPVRTLSVLEKVSRFERREHAGKQRTLSTSASHSKGNHLRMIEKSRNSLCGAEDIRHMLERSTKGTKAHRTLSYRGGSDDYTKYGTSADPSSALQRSRSTLQLDGCADVHSRNEFPWRQETQETLGPLQDTPSNRSYRDSLKNIQSKVLRSTSFRHRELSSSVSSIPSLGSSTFTPSSHQPPPVFAKTNSLEKKGPKTMPKPQGVILTPMSPLPIISPHTPKERHVVSPDVRGPSPPALPSLPPVGLPTAFRICGRKRLTADKKKRSYSEPENLNEVGVSDPETVARFRRKGETSVADRRKMFEHTSGRMGALAIKCDLRQVQQDALAEYVGRKKSVKRDKLALRGGSRPHSAYLQPDDSSYTDTHSLSSTSSLLSLQDFGQDKSFSSNERPLSSALPSRPDFQMIQSHLFYPDSLTTPRPKAHQPSSSSSKSSSELLGHNHPDPTHKAEGTQKTQSCSRDLKLAEPQANRGRTKPSNGALYRVESAQNAGKSASAENLLESLEHGQIYHQHHRSRSSPTMEGLNQNVFPDEVKMFDIFVSEPGRCALAANRPSELHVFEGSDESQISGRSMNTSQPAGSIQDTATSSTPNSRRERQRTSERQHAQSSSSLAASVGLPCPFSPPGTQDRNVIGWQVSEMLSQANFDAITFPQTGIADSKDHKGATCDREDKESRHSMSDATLLEDSPMDSQRDRAFSLGTSGDHSMQNTKPFLPVTTKQLTHPFALSEKDTTITASSPLPVFHPSSNHHFSSLQISESSLFSSIDQHQERDICTDTPQEDLDDVFLQNPPQPSPSPLIKETNIMEDFPPPPPPAELEQADEKQTMERFFIMSSASLKNVIIPTRTEFLQPFPATPSPPVFTPTVPSPDPSVEEIPEIPEIPTITTSITVEDDLGLEYQPLPKRERTSEELRVETLARQLVLRDPTLAPLLDTGGGQSIGERMEEIFISGKKTTNPHWPHKGSVQVEERIPDEVYNSNENTVTDGGSENILVDEEKDLTTRKVELCEALKSSMTALQKEKEALHEEQQRHQDVGARVETLVQKHLKPNEKEKYNMFIGDLDRIVNLLLSLFSRLSRIDQSLLTLWEDKLPEEVAKDQESLQHKRTLLLRQTEDAQELKENLDRRQRVVHTILSSYFTEPQLQDYHYFVSNKPSFLIQRRHLDDLIRQEEDRLTRLAESLPKEQAEAYGCFSLHFLDPVPFTKSLTPSIIPGTTYAPGSTTVTSL